MEDRSEAESSGPSVLTMPSSSLARTPLMVDPARHDTRAWRRAGAGGKRAFRRCGGVREDGIGVVAGGFFDAASRILTHLYQYMLGCVTSGTIRTLR
jgi:hypothetical protein